MATHILPSRGASPRASRATPTQHHCAAHNALTLAMLYFGRGDLPAARRKVAQAMDALELLREVSHG